MANIRRKGKVPVIPGQPFKDAELMEIQQAQENWNEYRLDDGTLIRTKNIAVEIWRVEGEYDPEGNPIYVIKNAPITVIQAPENLKRKA